MNALKSYIYLVLFSLILFSHDIMADKRYLYVVSSNTTLEGLHKKEIKHIYMDSISFDLKPINLKQGHTLRTVFNSKVIGLTESRIGAYWAQMKFTGRAKPPVEFKSETEVVQFLKSNPGFIGYISSQHDIPSFLSVIYKLPY